MIELGDLREGILPFDLEPEVKETIGMQGVKLAGVGTNLACFRGSQPNIPDNDRQAVLRFAEFLRRHTSMADRPEPDSPRVHKSRPV
jgi:predicted amino acid racemase